MAQPSVRGCLSVASAFSAVSALVAGLVGAWATIRFGPPLAMGLAMYAGNTEPVRPEAPYPWGLFAVGALIFGIGGVVERRAPGRPMLAHALMHGGGLFTALVPFVHLVHLWGRT